MKSMFLAVVGLAATVVGQDLGGLPACGVSLFAHIGYSHTARTDPVFSKLVPPTCSALRSLASLDAMLVT